MDVVSIMKKMVERLREGDDDVNEMDRVDDSDREFLISLIENELATMAKLQRELRTTSTATNRSSIDVFREFRLVLSITTHSTFTD